MFIQVNRKDFEFEIGRIIRPKVLKDITLQLQLEGNPTLERVYEFQTHNPSVYIMIYSSIDIRTEVTRPNGNDRVRLVMRWETRKGSRYRRLKHHNRVETLFKNIAETINKTKLEVFSCHLFRWTSSLEEILGSNKQEIN